MDGVGDPRRPRLRSRFCGRRSRAATRGIAPVECPPRWRPPLRRSGRPTRRDRTRVARARRASPRSCARSSVPALAAGRRLQRGEERLDHLSIRLVVEVLLDHLARAAYREVHRVATQLDHRLLALGLDFLARAVEYLLLLAVRLLENLGAHFLAGHAAFDDEALRVGVRLRDELLVLLEQPRRLLAIALGTFDRVLECLLPCLDRPRNRLERVTCQDEHHAKEDDDRPEHQTAVGCEQLRWLARSGLGRRRKRIA